MPIIQSAKKQLRAGQRRRAFNIARKGGIDTAVKAIKKLISEKKAKEALAFMPKVQKAFDKAVKTNLIKKNTASRKKSRIVAMIKKIK